MKYPSESKGLLRVFLSSVLIVYDKTKLKITTTIMTTIATTNAARKKENKYLSGALMLSLSNTTEKSTQT